MLLQLSYLTLLIIFSNVFRSGKVDGVESEDGDQPEEETDVPDGEEPLLESGPLKPSE